MFRFVPSCFKSSKLSALSRFPISDKKALLHLIAQGFLGEVVVVDSVVDGSYKGCSSTAEVAMKMWTLQVESG